MTSVETILQDVEPLNHTARVRYMIVLGRRMSDEPDVGAAIADLSRGDFMARYLALVTCYTSRDRALVLRSLADPSRIIRNLALRLVSLAGTLDDFAHAFAVVAPQSRIALLKKLHKHHQIAVIDAFLGAQAAQDDPRFTQMVSFGSAATVRRHQARFLDEAKHDAWLRLARMHPDIALEWIEAQVQTAGGIDAETGDRLVALMPMLPDALTTRAFALLDLYMRAHTLDNRRLLQLVKRFPREIADRILASDPRSYSHYNLFTSLVTRLTVEQIIDIAERFPSMVGHDFDWMVELPQETCLRVYEALRTTITLQRYQDSGILAALPVEVRLREARRFFADKNQSLIYRLEYAVFFPWEEMVASIDEALRSATADERRLALQTLIAATRYHPERLAEVLQLLQERRSEQDPVRRAIYRALSELPPSRWQAEHLPLLSATIRHGLNDVGLSEVTLQVMLALLLHIAPFQTEWATGQIATVIRERGFARPKITLDFLTQPVRDAILTALAPILQRWLAQAKEREMMQVIAVFAAGDRLPDAIVAILVTTLNATRDGQIADDILQLLRRHSRAQFVDLVPALVGADASWIICPAVTHELLRYRQDLLTPFLGYQTYEGRFDAGRRRFLLPLKAPATGLTTRQQEIYAATLGAIIADPEQESALQTRAILCLALLPAISMARLQALADHPRSIFRTTALLAIGRADSADGLPTILAALQDSRGRIAILMLQRYLHTMPADEALAILRGVPMSRVAVAKSVVRLIAAIPGETAFQELLALAGRELHPDVHAVVLETLWQHPTRPEIWPVMETNLAPGNRNVAQAALPPHALLGDAATLRRTIGDPPRSIHARALSLLWAGLDGDDEDSHWDILWRCQQVAMPDFDGIIVPRLIELTREAPRGEVEVPARAMFKLCTARDIKSIAGLFAAKQRLRHDLGELVDLLVTAYDSQADRLLSISRAVLATLADDPVLATLQAKLAFGTMSAEEFLAFLKDAVRADQMRGDTMLAMCSLIENRGVRFNPAEWEMLQQQLAASDAVYLRRIGFSCLLVQANRGYHNWDWTPARIAALQAFRADPSSLVAAAAQFHHVQQVDDADEEVEFDEDY